MGLTEGLEVSGSIVSAFSCAVKYAVLYLLLNKAHFLLRTNKQNDVPRHMLSGKGDLKQWAATTHLLEWPKSRTLPTPNTKEEPQKHSLQVEIQNGPLALEDGLIISYKTKRTVARWSSNYTLVFSQRGWKLTSTQKLYRNV